MKTRLLILFLALWTLPAIARAGDVLRPESPEVQECLKKTLPWFEANFNQAGGYGALNLLAYAEALRCTGEKSPYTTTKVMAEIDKVCQRAGKEHNTYVAGINCMLLSGTIREIDKLLGDGGLKSRGANKALRERRERCMTLMLDIIDNIETSIAPNGSWGYSILVANNQGTNHSTAQYALLGLEAAISCGIDVRKEVLNKAAEAFFDSQNADGGWGYQVRGSNFQNWAQSYPAMAAVGLASLKIAEDHLTDKNKKRYKKAVADCLKYMEKAYTPKTLDDIYKKKNSFWCYQMYCVERAGVFLEVDHFGRKDWYDMGARPMIAAQRKNDGSIAPPHASNLWNEQKEATAFCVLFLSKGSANVRKRYEISGVSKADELISGMMRLWNKIDSPEDTEAIEKLRTALTAEPRAADRFLSKVVPKKLFIEIEKQQTLDVARKADITALVNFAAPSRKTLDQVARLGSRTGFSKKFFGDVVWRQPKDGSKIHFEKTDLSTDLVTLDPEFYNRDEGDAWSTLEFWSRSCGAFADRKDFAGFDRYVKRCLKRHKKHPASLIFEILEDPRQKDAVNAAAELRKILDEGGLKDFVDAAPYTLSLLVSSLGERSVLRGKLRSMQWDTLRAGRERTAVETRLLLHFQLNEHLAWKSGSEIDHETTDLVRRYFETDADYDKLLEDADSARKLIRIFQRFK